VSAAPQRIGLFGGAFDPPHLAHVALAHAACEQLQLDALRIIPTGQAWHKPRALSPAEHRLAMCQHAFGDEPRFVLDDRETRRVGPSYTIDTLRALQAEAPQAEFFLVLGADQLRALPTWHQAEAVVRAATIAVASRADAQGVDESPVLACAVPGARVQTLHMPTSALSATEIRKKAALGADLAPLVPAAVARYIDQHHLYRTAP